MNIEQAIESYLQDRSLGGIADSSISDYRHQFVLFQRWLKPKGITDTAALTAEDFKTFLWLERPRVRQSTLCHKRAILINFARWLRTNEHSDLNPDRIPMVGTAKPDEIRRVWITDEQCAELFAFLTQEYKDTHSRIDLRNLAATALLFGGGLRHWRSDRVVCR